MVPERKEAKMIAKETRATKDLNDIGSGCRRDNAIETQASLTKMDVSLAVK